MSAAAAAAADVDGVAGDAAVPSARKMKTYQEHQRREKVDD